MAQALLPVSLQKRHQPWTQARVPVPLSCPYEAGLVAATAALRGKGVFRSQSGGPPPSMVSDFAIAHQRFELAVWIRR